MSTKSEIRLPLSCDCGAKGALVLQEDAGGGDPRRTHMVSISGPFVKTKAGYQCSGCQRVPSLA